MPFDVQLDERIQTMLVRRKGLERKKMFGGIGFLLNGNMMVGVWKTSLIVRIGLDSYGDALLEPHVREFDITGKPMKGWVMVDREGIAEDLCLENWIERAAQFVKTLPAK